MHLSKEILLYSKIKYWLILLSFKVFSTLGALHVSSFSLPLLQNTSGSILPFTLHGGLIIIQAKVNDSIGNFVLDTGAEGLVLNQKYFSGTMDESRRYYGVGGQGEGLFSSLDNRLSVEALEFNNLKADVVDLSAIEKSKMIRISGLLGFYLLKDYEIMFNYRERYLAFSTLDAKGRLLDPLPFTQDKVDSVSFFLGKIIPVIEVEVNGIRKRFGLDSGAEINLLDLKRSKNIMAEFVPMRTIRMAGADNEEKEVLAGRLRKVALLGKYRCAPMSTVLVNMSYLDKIYGVDLDGILGYEFLAPWRISINYKKQRLYLHKMNTPLP